MGTIKTTNIDYILKDKNSDPEMIALAEKELGDLEKKKEELIKTLEELKEQRTKSKKEGKPKDEIAVIVEEIKKKDDELKQTKEDLKEKKLFHSSNQFDLNIETIINALDNKIILENSNYKVSLETFWKDIECKI